MMEIYLVKTEWSETEPQRIGLMVVWDARDDLKEMYKEGGYQLPYGCWGYDSRIGDHLDGMYVEYGEGEELPELIKKYTGLEMGPRILDENSGWFWNVRAWILGDDVIGGR